MKVSIFGSGISGLTVAHELVEKGYKVEIYEKDNIGGGMARSFRNKYGVPTEHSWRGYGPFYYNTFEIMKRIPLKTTKENFTNKYSLDEVKDHNKEDDLWTIYRGNIYDITHFVNSHPGGKSNILKCAGKDIEKVWKELGYEFHLNSSDIIKTVKKNKVGSLVENFKDNSVYDNLNTDRLKFKYLYNNSNGRGEPNLTILDLIFLFFLFGKVICSDKRRYEYFSIRLDPIIKKNLSKEGYHFISDFLAGPGWGFDKKTMSLGHYATFVEYSLNEKDKNWQVMKKPTSEAWIDPWISYLKMRGVVFNFNNELLKINADTKQVNSCIIKRDSKQSIVTSDIYIFAINPFNFADILENSKFRKDKLYKNLKEGNIINNQISFRLGFDRKIEFGEKTTGYVLIDSAYNITFYPQEDSWDKNVSLGMNGKIKTLLSGTIILPYNKGVLYNKTATSLKLEELKKEIVEQFFLSNDFKKYTDINKITKKNIIFKEIFADWYEDGNYLKSKNRKWVNNSYNEKYRLENKTELKNMYICGSHCVTSINIWSMEGAVESGKRCSNIILNRNNQKECYIYNHGSVGLVILLQNIENIFYGLGLRNVIIELITCLLFYIIYNLVYKFIRYKKGV